MPSGPGERGGSGGGGGGGRGPEVSGRGAPSAARRYTDSNDRSYGGSVPAVSDKGLGGQRRRDALAALAPGTALRDGLERILRGSTGALIVLGYDQAVA